MNSRRKFLQTTGLAAAAALAANPAKTLAGDVSSFWQTGKLTILHTHGNAVDHVALQKANPADVVIKAQDAIDGVETEIVRRGDVKIGIIHIGKGNADIFEKVNDSASALKQKGCDVVVCTSALGFRGKNICDEALAQQSKNLDLIISSNNIEPVSSRVLLNTEGHEVLLDNAGGAEQSLASLEIKFNAARQKNFISFAQHSLN